VPEPVEDPEVKEVSEASLAETFCPECRTIVSGDAETCYACGADLKNPRPQPKDEAPKPEPKVEEKSAAPKEEPRKEEATAEQKEDGKPRSVSIRKIIKRK